MLDGHCRLGGTLSRTTRTRKVHVLRFVQSSVAVQVTVVVPAGKGLPEGGEHATVTLESALSVAIGAGKVTGTVEALPQMETERLLGH